MAVMAPPTPVVAGWDARRPAALVTVGSAALVLLAAVVGPLLPVAAGPVVLVVAGLLGLPHGAVDHLALSWSRGREGTRPAVLVGYALAAVAAAAAALAAPGPALVVLLVLSVAHFAEGERAFDRLRGGRGRLLPAVAVGLEVVSVPLLLHPAAGRAVLDPVDPGLLPALAPARTALLALTALVVLAALVAARRDARVAGELLVVTLLVLLAPPLVAFGAWFAGWHASRHLVRLAALQPSGDGTERLRRLARAALLPSLGALVGLAALVLVLGGVPGALLLVLLALTVPHAAVVARLSAPRPRAWG